VGAVRTPEHVTADRRALAPSVPEWRRCTRRPPSGPERHSTERAGLAGVLNTIDAARMLVDWGFLAHSDLPDGDGPAFLLVAIRPNPTGHHFDPERVTYWVSRHDRGKPAEIDAATPMPLQTRFAWGTIALTDRFGVRNEWVACGGELTASQVDDMIVCVFQSDAPILRRGGHSQGWDHGAASLAAFFGRIKVAVDFVSGFEARLCAATPRTFLAAFLGDLDDRYRRSTLIVDIHPALWALVRTEAARMRQREPDTWAAGQELRLSGCLAQPPAP
jgi:hypothetical protein